MNSVIIQINKKKLQYEGPSSWEECSPQQYVNLHRLREKAKLDAHAQFLLTRVVYDIPERYAQYFFDKAAMEILGVKDEDEQDFLTQQGIALIETCAWVWSGEMPSKWMIPIYRINVLLEYYGPGDHLNLLTFEDFWYAELFYSQRNFTKLMTILYRVKHSQSKSRLFLNTEKINEYANRFAGMNVPYQEAIFFNYEGCRQYLALCFPHVFEKKTETTQPAGTWLDVAVGMAGDDPNKFNAYRKENLYIVLKMLENNLVQIEKLKADAPHS